MFSFKKKSSLSEAELVKELRSRLEPGLLHPAFDHHWNFIRFLEMQRFDEKKALRKLREHLQLRRYLRLDDGCVGPDHILPAYLERWPGGCLDTEPGGVGEYSECFVCVAPFNGYVIPGDLAANITHSDFFRSLIIDAELQYRNAQRREALTGKRSGVIILIDVEGLRLDLAGIHPLIAISNCVIHHFPHYSLKNLIVNASPIVERLWRLTHHLFPASISNGMDFVRPEDLPKYIRFVGHFPHYSLKNLIVNASPIVERLWRLTHHLFPASISNGMDFVRPEDLPKYIRFVGHFPHYSLKNLIVNASPIVERLWRLTHHLFPASISNGMDFVRPEDLPKYIRFVGHFPHYSLKNLIVNASPIVERLWRLTHHLFPASISNGMDFVRPEDLPKYIRFVGHFPHYSLKNLIVNASPIVERLWRLTHHLFPASISNGMDFVRPEDLPKYIRFVGHFPHYSLKNLIVNASPIVERLWRLTHHLFPASISNGMDFVRPEDLPKYIRFVGHFPHYSLKNLIVNASPIVERLWRLTHHLFPASISNGMDFVRPEDLPKYIRFVGHFPHYSLKNLIVNASPIVERLWRLTHHLFPASISNGMDFVRPEDLPKYIRFVGHFPHYSLKNLIVNASPIVERLWRLTHHLFPASISNGMDFVRPEDLPKYIRFVGHFPHYSLKNLIVNASPIVERLWRLTHHLFPASISNGMDFVRPEDLPKYIRFVGHFPHYSLKNLIVNASPIVERLWRLTHHLFPASISNGMDFVRPEDLPKYIRFVGHFPHYSLKNLIVNASPIVERLWRLTHHLFPASISNGMDFVRPEDLPKYIRFVGHFPHYSLKNLIVNASPIVERLWRLTHHLFPASISNGMDFVRPEDLPKYIRFVGHFPHYSLKNLIVNASPIVERLWRLTHHLFPASISNGMDFVRPEDLPKYIRFVGHFPHYSLKNLIVNASPIVERLWRLTHHLFPASISNGMDFVRPEDLPKYIRFVGHFPHYSLKNLIVNASPIVERLWRLTHHLFPASISNGMDFVRPEDLPKYIRFVGHFPHYSLKNLIVNASPIVERLWRLTHHLFPASISNGMDFVRPEDLPKYIRFVGHFPHYSLKNLIVNASPIVERLWRLTHHLFPASISNGMDFVRPEDLPKYIRFVGHFPHYSLKNLIVNASPIVERLWRLTHHLFPASISNGMDFVRPEDLPKYIRFVGHFPHYSLKNLIVNASPIVERLWRLTHHLFPASISNGMDFVRPEDLPKYIRPSVTPVRLGGELVDAEGSAGCEAIFRRPGPEKLHFLPAFDAHEELAAMDGLQDLSVPRGGLRWLNVQATEVGQTLSWFYYSHDWHSFGLYFSESPEEEEREAMELAHMPYPYFTPTTVPEENSIVIQKTGWYKFCFGNEGAFFSRCRLQYRIKLE